MNAADAGCQAVVTRSELLARLGSPEAGLPALTVLSAPYGYGKTTLLRQWTANLPSQIVWVDCAEINEPEDLWCRVAEKLHGDGAEAAFKSNLCRNAVLEWLKTLVSPVVVVFDDFHEVTSPRIDEQLVRLLERSPDVFVVVAGRRFDLLDNPLLTSRLDSLVLRSQDIAFADDEVAKLPGIEKLLEDSEIAEKLTRLKGWPAALDVILASVTDSSGTFDRHRLRQYVYNVVGDPISKKVLAAAIFLGGVSKTTLAGGLGLHDEEVGESLSALQSSGLLEQGWESARELFAAHPALTDEELWISGADIDATAKERLIVANAHEVASDDPLRALRLLLKMGMLHEADRLAVRHFARLFTFPAETLKLLAELPADSASDAPTLTGLLLLVERSSQSVPRNQVQNTAKRLREAVLPLIEESGPADAEIVHLALLASAERILGNWEAALTCARQLELRLSEHRYVSYWEGWSALPLMYSVASLAGTLAGDLAMAERAAAMGLQIATGESNPSEQVRALNQLAFLAALRRDRDLTDERLRESKRIQESAGVSPPELSGVNGLLASATLALMDGDVGAGLKELASAESSLDRTELWAQFLLVESWLTRFEHGHKEALRTLRNRVSERSDFQLSPYSSAQLAAAMADLAMRGPDIVAVDELLQKVPVETDEVILARARLALVRGTPWEAVRGLDTLVADDLPPAMFLTAALLRAAAVGVAGDMPSAVNDLARLRPSDAGASLPAILSTIPYHALHGVAAAAYEAGFPELLAGAQSLPNKYRFGAAKPLSPAEMSVLDAIAKRGTVKRAAESIDLSHNTVKAHVRRIYSKLGVKSKTEMLATAQRMGLI